jgi:four helix bundle protein
MPKRKTEKRFEKKYSISDELRERVFRFGINILELVAQIPDSIESRVLKRQICKSSTSIGANLEEADGSLTLNDFIYKVDIGYKECKETRYWLRIIQTRKLIDYDTVTPHLNENMELIKILSTIIYRCLKKV